MENTILNTLTKYQMLQSGDNVILALSGGADSVALFHFFLRHRAALGVGFSALHCNHGLRGPEADRDEAFVRALCREAGVPLYVEHFHMADAQKPRGLSIETWARRLRYAVFERLALEKDACVATAHTQNDNAETVLFHAARGCGTKGLSGIPPVRPPCIRPLLFVGRGQIEAYCAENALAYVTDSTNADTAYARNQIRLHALPALEKAHAGATAALARLAQDMGELDGYLAGEAAKLIDAGRAALHTEKAAAAPRPVRLKALAMLAGRDTDRPALERMEQLVLRGAGATQLAGHRRAAVEKGWLAVQKTAPPRQAQPFALPFGQGTFSLPGGYEMEITLTNRPFNAQEFEKISEKGLTFCADYGKIFKCDLIRTRRGKDSYRPPRRGVTKSLKKWMQESGIPPGQRHSLPLLCRESTVLWVWGQGFCDGVAPDENTKEWLVVQTAAREETEHGKHT